MKRFHVHVSVADLSKSTHFYSTLFGAKPTIEKQDYAKWMLEDPRVNFAISIRGNRPGIDHLGLQVESGEELAALRENLTHAEMQTLPQTDTACCYARSDKHWVVDPQGIAWESFHTLAEIPVFGAQKVAAEPGTQSRCGPPIASIRSACCGG